jgi:hypothetical protein
MQRAGRDDRVISHSFRESSVFVDGRLPPLSRLLSGKVELAQQPSNRGTAIPDGDDEVEDAASSGDEVWTPGEGGNDGDCSGGNERRSEGGRESSCFSAGGGGSGSESSRGRGSESGM